MPPQTFAKKKFSAYTIQSLNTLLPKQKSDTAFTSRPRPRSSRKHNPAMNHQTTLPESEKATGVAMSLENPLQ